VARVRKTVTSPRSRLVTTERTAVSISDFAAEIVRLEDEAEKTNILVYGDSNCGKTVLAGTCPGKTFWLIGEPGYKSAARQGARGLGHVINNPAVAWAAIEWLREKERYRRLDWLIVDGASTIQDKVRFGYTQEAFDLRPGSRAHRNLPDKPDYFNTQNWVKSWISSLIDLDVNLLVTCHAYRTDKTDGGELLVFPGFQGKVTEVSNAISGLMDVTAYMEARRLRMRDSNRTKEVRRLWFTSPERKSRDEDEVRYIAGDKLACLGQRMDSPTIPRIMAAINGETAQQRREGED
jgi:hypothetical protein